MTIERKYPELAITIRLSTGRDTTADTVTFTDGSGVVHTIENSLRHQPAGVETVSGTLGIKNFKKPDFTVVRLAHPSAAAAIFTTCRSPSYTVVRNREVLRSGALQAVAVNSGNANVYTPTGANDLSRCARLIAAEFSVEERHLLISSTGVIGVSLPVDRFESGVPGLAAKLAPNQLDAAATAILTTDLGPKVASFRSGDFILSGIAKGAGMIEPHLATMLVYFFTNARIESAKLQQILERSAAVSFNSISIDSDTSTSDTVALLTTGEIPIDEDLLFRALRAMSVKLARDIVSQGEGVSKTIECTVGGALTPPLAKRLAKQIINSPLVKTAVHGADPNWGRVVAAFGKPLADHPEPLFDESGVRISMAGIPVFSGADPITPDLAAVRARMQSDKVIPIDVTIGDGPALARVWGSDLTEEYVTYNSDYTS